MMMVYLMVGVISRSGCIGERFMGLGVREASGQAAGQKSRAHSLLACMGPEPASLDA